MVLQKIVAYCWFFPSSCDKHSNTGRLNFERPSFIDHHCFANKYCITAVMCFEALKFDAVN